MKSLKEKKEEKNQNKKEKKTSTSTTKIDEHDINIVPSAYMRGIVRKDLKRVGELVGMNAEEINEWQSYMVLVGWRYPSLRPVNSLSFQRSLRMWHKVNVSAAKRERGNRRLAASMSEQVEKNRREKLVKQAESDPAMWDLCRECCANCGASGCERGIKVPPDRQLPRPSHLSECPLFDERRDGV